MKKSNTIILVLGLFISIFLLSVFSYSVIGQSSCVANDELLVGGVSDYRLHVFDYQNGVMVNIFDLTTKYNTVNEARVGDINNDGKNEIVVVSDSGGSGPGAVQFFRNNAGTWSNYYNYSGNCGVSGVGSSHHLAIADTDSDNNLEVVYGCGHQGIRNGELSILKNTAGTVTVNKIATINYDSYYDIEVANLDGDSYPEIFMDNDGASPSLIFVYEYNGINYTRTTSFKSGGIVDEMDSGDVNGDGIPELIFCGGAGLRKVRIFNSAGDNIYQGRWNSTDYGGSNMVQACGTGDFNGNGKADIFAGVVYAGQPEAFYEKDDNVIENYAYTNKWNYINTGSGTENVGAGAAGDFDSDERDEWVFGDGVAIYYVNNDTAPYGPPFNVIQISSFTPNVISIGDVDNDGNCYVCGNGIKEPAESCDGSDFAGNTCDSLGYLGGNLSCNSDCTFDTTQCITNPCGDGYCDGSIGENCNTCSKDCISGLFGICGDGVCLGSLFGETCNSCSLDCIKGTKPGGTCSACFRSRCDGVCDKKKETSTCADCNPTINYCCGDNVCNGNENILNCPVDCGGSVQPHSYCCGDGICEGSENPINCDYDC